MIIIRFYANCLRPCLNMIECFIFYLLSYYYIGYIIGYMYIFYKNSLEFYISYMPDVFTEFK